MTQKTLYEITDPNAQWIAGKRAPEDRRIALTEEEARYELIAGAIRPAKPIDGPRRNRNEPAAEPAGSAEG